MNEYTQIEKDIDELLNENFDEKVDSLASDLFREITDKAKQIDQDSEEEQRFESFEMPKRGLSMSQMQTHSVDPVQTEVSILNHDILYLKKENALMLEQSEKLETDYNDLKETFDFLNKDTLEKPVLEISQPQTPAKAKQRRSSLPTVPLSIVLNTLSSFTVNSK
jgi:hypothetical protein